MTLEQTVARIDRIAWFARCGEPSALEIAGWRLRRVPLIRARTLVSGHAWFELLHAALGDLQEFVFLHARDRHNCWNDYSRETKLALATAFADASRALGDASIAPDAFPPTRIQLIGACMEARFADLEPPIFFGNLLKVYEAGHLPCGWLSTFRSNAEGPRPDVVDFVREADIAYY